MNIEKIDRLFLSEIEKIYNKYLPSNHIFFTMLSDFPHEKLRSPNLLGNFHLRYQSACHATRVMIYRIPYLENPSLRNRLLKVISDDDQYELFDSHHYQLTRLFVNMGAKILIDDESFGELDRLKENLDSNTAYFVTLVQQLYIRNPGAWCVIEMFANNWMKALMNSLLPCFPFIDNEPYFSECFNQGIETKHAQESLFITSKVLQRSPELFEQTICDANRMAKGLNILWNGLGNLLKENY
ncbi:MAG: hypothetical protein AAGE84_13940 [Cyanobacteria bacterium P01_G01_bin.39]